MTKMTADTKRQALALADALAPLANDAATLHWDMRDNGEWGTGVTQSIERKLTDIADDLRVLLAEAAK